MRDFTLKQYDVLLDALITGGYSILPFRDFLDFKGPRVIALRHDVDNKPGNSLQIATIENRKGIRSTYYFRIVRKSNVPAIIKKIAALGHEIGYHYEDLTLAEGDLEKAIGLFNENLAYFRKFYPVTTICMHGSPMSRFDNRGIWNEIDYRDYGITGEPFFDIDFTEVFYLTDTGRAWNNSRSSIRDKVTGGDSGVTAWHSDIRVQSTGDIIRMVNGGTLPDKVMIATHPQRWNDQWIPWLAELILQNGKNLVKRTIVSRSKAHRS